MVPSMVESISSTPIAWELFYENDERDDLQRSAASRKWVTGESCVGGSQRDYNQAGWKKEIRNFRIQIKKILKDSPSLKSYLREILQECYLDARNLLIDETQLDASIFPLEVLANLEEILDENWLPNWEAISNNSEQ